MRHGEICTAEAHGLNAAEGSLQIVGRDAGDDIAVIKSARGKGGFFHNADGVAVDRVAEQADQLGTIILFHTIASVQIPARIAAGFSYYNRRSRQLQAARMAAA